MPKDICGASNAKLDKQRTVHAKQRGEFVHHFWESSYAEPNTSTTSDLGCSTHRDACAGAPTTVPCCQTLLAEMLFDVLDLLDEHDVVWAINYGAAISAQLDGTLFPYDTRDIDLCLAATSHKKGIELIEGFVRRTGLVVRQKRPFFTVADDAHVYTRRFHEKHGYPSRDKSFCFGVPEFDFDMPEFQSPMTLSNRAAYLEVR